MTAGTGKLGLGDVDRWLSAGSTPAPLQPGDEVVLADEPGCIIPAGRHRVSSVAPDGSFHVGGNTAVWPRRIAAHFPLTHAGRRRAPRLARLGAPTKGARA